MKYRHGAINRTGGQSTLLYACVCARHPDRIGVKQQSWPDALSPDGEPGFEPRLLALSELRLWAVASMLFGVSRLAKISA
jgi:hypothetical protein